MNEAVRIPLYAAILQAVVLLTIALYQRKAQSKDKSEETKGVTTTAILDFSARSLEEEHAENRKLRQELDEERMKSGALERRVTQMDSLIERMKRCDTCHYLHLPPEKGGKKEG